MLLFQLNRTDLPHIDTELIIKNIDTRLLVNSPTSFLSDTLKTQLVVSYDLELVVLAPAH